jgi:hypothetical protein
MPAETSRPRPLRKRATQPRPSDAGRRFVRRQVGALPGEWAEVDALAVRLARPGYRENVSETLRACVRFVLHAEALGLCTIDQDGIRLRERGR